MADDSADGFFLEGRFEDEPRIDGRGRNTALADFFEMLESSGLVEIEHPEDLIRVVHQLRPEISGGCRAVFYDGLFEGHGYLSAAAYFHGGGDGYRLCQ